MFDHPQNLEQSEISGNWQACSLFECFTVLVFEGFANLLASIIAPNDGIVKRFALLVPANNCLSLVCHPRSQNAPNFKFTACFFCLFNRGSHAELYILDDLERVMLEPPIGGSDLFVLK
jgi:hypothetical protein